MIAIDYDKLAEQIQKGELSEGEIDDYIRQIQTRQECIAEEMAEYEKKHRLEFFEPNCRTQERFVDECNAKELFLFGGNQSGKTTAGAVKVCNFLLGRYEGKRPKPHFPINGWACSVDYDTLAEVVEPKIMEYFPYEKIARGYPKGDIRLNRTLKTTDGCKLTYKSYKSGEEAFQGRVLDFIWDDEQTTRKIYSEQRQRIARYGMAFTTMTPAECLKQGGTLWVYRQIVEPYQRCVHTEPERFKHIQIYYMTKMDNVKYLGQESIDRDLITMDEREKQVRIYGQWVKWLGRVFPNWLDQYPFVIDNMVIPHHWTVYMALDPHERTPYHILWVAVNPENDLYVFDELVGEPGWVPEDYVREIRRKNGEHGKEPMLNLMDSAYCSKPTMETGKTLQEVFENLGIYFEPWHRDKAGGIKLLEMYFKVDPGDNKPHCFILQRCRQLRYELMNYSWDEFMQRAEDKEPKQKVRKIDDHLIDCLIAIAKANPMYWDEHKVLLEPKIDELSGVVLSHA